MNKTSPLELLTELKLLETLITLNDHLFELVDHSGQYFKLVKSVKVTRVKDLPLWSAFAYPDQVTIKFSIDRLWVWFNINPAGVSSAMIDVDNLCIATYEPIYYSGDTLRYRDYHLVRNDVHSLVMRRNFILDELGLKEDGLNAHIVPPSWQMSGSYALTLLAEYRELCKLLKELPLKPNKPKEPPLKSNKPKESLFKNLLVWFRSKW